MSAVMSRPLADDTIPRATRRFRTRTAQSEFERAEIRESRTVYRLRRLATSLKAT
jgi:hypothetical protein